MLSEAELTILGLTAERPRYGYDIERVIDERGLRDWLSVGFSSIYYILTKLERQALISARAETEAEARASHKIYQISEAGKGVLQTALVELLRHPRMIGTGFELGLANLDLLSPQQIYQALLYHQIELHRRIEATVAAWERSQQREHAAQAALYTHALALMRAEADWLAAFVRDWKATYPAVETGQIPKVELDDDPDATVRHEQTQLKAAKRVQLLKRPPTE